MNPESRRALLTHCPVIFKAMGDALIKASAQAATAGTDDEQKEQDEASTDPETKAKTKGNMNARSSNMLKAKRLKPLLGCLSATVSAVSGGDLKGMVSEVRDVKHALRAVAKACASLPMESLCNRAVGELDRVLKGEAVEACSEDGEGGKNRENGESLSPGTKRKAEEVVQPAIASGDAGRAGGEGGGKRKSNKTPKKKR